MRNLQIRLLDQCFKYGKTHLGSSFSSLSAIVEIYEKMISDDVFILSNGHAASALYVVLEKFKGIDSSRLFESMGDHPKRDLAAHIHCSTGSLGMGITVAVGMAMANEKKQVYCLVSDGECAEGSVWEALRFANRMKLKNLHLFFNFNGWSALGSVDTAALSIEVKTVYPGAEIRNSSLFPFEQHNLHAHYIKLNEEEYFQARAKLCV